MFCREMDVKAETLTSHSTERARYASKIQETAQSEICGLSAEHVPRIKSIN